MSASIGDLKLVLESLNGGLSPAVLEQSSAAPSASVLNKYLVEQLPVLAKQLSRIAFKTLGRVIFLSASELLAVEAQGNYVLLLKKDSKSHMLRASISGIEHRLRPHGFVRIHRSVLVNTAVVEEIRPRPSGEYDLRIKGGKEYTVTRKYKDNLKLLAESWIGAGTFLSAR